MCQCCAAGIMEMDQFAMNALKISRKPSSAHENNMLSSMLSSEFVERKMNLAVRKWRIDDKSDLAIILNNPKVLNNLRDGLPYPYMEKDAEDFIRSMLSADKDNTFAFAITLDDKVIGSIGVFRQDNIHCKTAEMGYYIGEPYWGNGYATTAIKQVCKYVFEKTDIIRIYAEPFAHNIASCRALEKAGFQYEGTLKSNAVKCGSIVDMKMYALVRE